MIKFVVLLAIASLLPVVVHNQMITGPIINATLFLAVLTLDIQSAILIGLIPSIVALSVGLLPAPLVPIVPFIMLSNTILVVVFNWFKDKNYWLGVVSASLLKFLFLFGTSSIVINLLLKQELAQKVSLMMSWPQLATALAGGIIAFGIYKFIKK
jgi:hypothetical protein